MSRALKIQYPKAWYHIMNRGRRFEKIFNDNEDYQTIVDLLRETSEMWNIRIAAYCLMPNHYHLLVQTPDANIARSMRHVNGVYTQSYNRRHKCDGSLFRGRYKSILVSAASYLLQLVRYIHNNPKKAVVVKNPGHYGWSSHSHQRYLFICGEEIFDAVCTHYRVELDDLFVSRRGQFDEPRNVGIYLFRRLRQVQLKDTRKYFQIVKYSSVSSIIERLKARLKTDKDLKNRVDNIFADFNKSQGQT